jgi:hypothetical protein
MVSVCSLRRAKFPIIYPDLRLDYKVATHPLVGAPKIVQPGSGLNLCRRAYSGNGKLRVTRCFFDGNLVH